MNDANYIVFSGYSFPDSDTEMAYFLASSLWQNAGLSKILVIDPYAEQLMERLRTGRRFGNHFVDFVTLQPRAWQVGGGALPLPFAWKPEQ